MGSTVDKAKGHANEAIGKAKEKLGAAVGSDEMEAKGIAQNIKGKAQVGIGEAKEATKKVVDDL
jgi:uncharacterized protein YjbJ (UPF0337 family)